MSTYEGRLGDERSGPLEDVLERVRAEAAASERASLDVAAKGLRRLYRRVEQGGAEPASDPRHGQGSPELSATAEEAQSRGPTSIRVSRFRRATNDATDARERL